MCEGGSRNRRAPDELGSDAAAEGPRVVCYYKDPWLVRKPDSSNVAHVQRIRAFHLRTSPSRVRLQPDVPQ